jgi:hypothetical protein
VSTIDPIAAHKETGSAMPNVSSYCLTLNGTPYENGSAKGRFVVKDPFLHRNLVDRLRWFDAYDRESVDLERMDHCKRQVTQRLPSLLDEIRGFTKALDISYEQYLPYLLFDWEIPSHCSQFCVLPGITEGRKVYSGHSWEWTMEAEQPGRRQTLEEDNLYVVVKGQHAAYMGFALNYFGLWNGMNACSVSINPTGGVPLPALPVTKKLYNHGLLVRIALETCHSAEEALDVIREFLPLSSGGGGSTLIVADRSGTAYYVERAGGHFACVQVGRDTGREYQCAANHFVLPAMFPYASKKGVHSIVRHAAMNAWIEAHAPRITMETLLAMQQRHLPDGPCCHYYAAFLGTVRSMVYNLTDLQAMVCFGSPRLNPWHAYDFNVHTTGMQAMPTTYVNEEADPEIWKHVPPAEAYDPAGYPHVSHAPTAGL